MNKVRVRAIIPLGEGLIFMHRIRMINGKLCEYYPTPGGGVEPGETLDEALNREIKEELGIKVKIIREIYKFNDNVSTQHIFLCEYMEGTFATGTGPEFSDAAYKESGKYIPEIVKFDDLSKINIVPIEFKNQLLKDLENNSLDNINYKEIKINNTTVM